MSSIKSITDIDLTKAGAFTSGIDVSEVNSISVTGRNAASWASGVVDLEKSYDGETYEAFSTPIQLSTSTLSSHAIDVRDVWKVRYKCSTAQAGQTATLILFGKAVSDTAVAP